jgi:hypothetical protein
MSERKYIFKIVPGKQFDNSYMCYGPMHRIKLVGENHETKEISLEPYFLSYDVKYGSKLTNYLSENNQKNLVAIDKNTVYTNQAKMTWDYNNDKPCIELPLPLRVEIHNGKKHFHHDYVALPDLSLNFHMDHSQLKELIEKSKDNFIYLNTNIEGDTILMRDDNKGQSICTLNGVNL